MKKEDLYLHVPCPDDTPGCLVYHVKLDQDKMADAIVELDKKLEFIEVAFLRYKVEIEEKLANLKNTFIAPTQENSAVETFGFETALTYLKEGKRVNRKIWKINRATVFSNNDLRWEEKEDLSYIDGGNEYLEMCDILAEDWYLVE